jgi:hypothetical protein
MVAANQLAIAKLLPFNRKIPANLDFLPTKL